MTSTTLATLADCLAFTEMHTGNGCRRGFTDEVLDEQRDPDAERIAEAGRAALDLAATVLTVPRCIYPGCCDSRRTRGLCHQHYQTMRSYVRAGKATETDLERRGLLLEQGKGGASTKSHDAFLTGSTIQGSED